MSLGDVFWRMPTLYLLGVSVGVVFRLSWVLCLWMLLGTCLWMLLGIVNGGVVGGIYEVFDAVAVILVDVLGSASWFPVGFPLSAPKQGTNSKEDPHLEETTPPVLVSC